MVAKVTILKRLLDALNYNEKKVHKGKAECIHAGNYIGDGETMTFYQKLTPLKLRDELNTRASTKTLHVSLNFDPSENLNHETLHQIADTYMQTIGFGDQPYLVYRHHDAGHPHIHIISTAIKADGARISTHNIGKLQSEKARKEIEVLFGLVKASSKQTRQSSVNAIANALQYGKAETRESISRVVNAVFLQYTFTSLPEFNAALRQFNVVADRGTEHSRVFKNRGLLFRIIDETGSKVGVPIKASLISCRPTLANLEKHFLLNKEKKDQAKNKVKAKVDYCLEKKHSNLNDLIQELKTQNFYTVLRQNSDGRIYGITLVDNETKCVFNGSDLGKQYSIAGLQERLKRNTKLEDAVSGPGKYLQPSPAKDQHASNAATVIKDLLTPIHDQQNVPHELRRKKKRKKNND